MSESIATISPKRDIYPLRTYETWEIKWRREREIWTYKLNDLFFLQSRTIPSLFAYSLVLQTEAACSSESWYQTTRRHITEDCNLHPSYNHRSHKLCSLFRTSLCAPVRLFHHHEHVWGSGGIVPPFLTSVLDGGEWSTSVPYHFTVKETRTGTHWYCRTGLDFIEKINISYPCWVSNPSSP
jgi:hypothetical protein